MSYTSLLFFTFVLLVTAVYFLFPVKKYQWTVLLIASYMFYLISGYKYVVFILITTLSTYYAALWIERIAVKAKTELDSHKADWDKEQKKKYKGEIKKAKQSIVALPIILNLGILFLLKNYNFLAGSLSDLFRLSGVSFSVPSLNVFLPLGISFYTFQSIGYVMDVYREKISAERNIAKVALFVSFFPQIIQGPISFYNQLAGQLYEPRQFDFTQFKYGCELILWGLFKKLVIADRAYIAIKTVLDDFGDYSGTTLTFIILLYALQLYTDFSGGIDISRGVAQILGIDMVQNFRHPYFATTINDYWRRWHITLGNWMKEYIFYPLALSKPLTNITKRIKSTEFGASEIGIHITKVLPASVASLVVFILVGIWHGTNWKYVAFGIWNGGVIMLSLLLEPLLRRFVKKLRINVKSKAFVLFQMARTFVIVFIGYVFDVAADFGDAMYTFRMMLTDQNFSRGWVEINALGLGKKDYLVLAGCTMVVFIVSAIQEKCANESLRVMLDQKPFFVRYILLLVGIIVLLVFGIYGPGYNPADFVYMQF